MRRGLIPDITNLQAFECAARHASFTRAAQELSLTQSAVSRQVQDLEHQTGLMLFERVRQRIMLSEAGARLLPEVRQLLQQSERLMIGAVAAANMKMALNIATLPTLGMRWLMPRLPGFLERWPDVALSVGSRSKPFNFEDETFDLAIHFGRPIWAGAKCTYLFGETVVPVASERLARKLTLESPQDIAHCPLLHVTTRPQLWNQWFTTHGIEVDNAYRGTRFDHFSMIIAAVISGMGVALLPSFLIEDELASGALQVVCDLPLATDNNYYLAMPDRNRHSEIANRFEEWILGEIAPAGPRAQ